MKKSHLIGIVVIAIAIGAIMSTISDSSSYATFSEAFSNRGAEYHVVGQLNRQKEMVYEPEINPGLFTFYMLDSEGVERKVFLHKSKPQDFERSEQIVIIGKAQGNEFHASEILMKCPSKYNDSSDTPGNNDAADSSQN